MDLHKLKRVDMDCLTLIMYVIITIALCGTCGPPKGSALLVCIWKERTVRLTELRTRDTKWHIIVLGGPGVKAGIGETAGFEKRLQEAADQLGVTVEHFQSNHEGKLLEFVHSSRDRASAYLVNPGGLVRVGESLRHTLKDAKKPTVEVHLDNHELSTQSIFAPSVLSIFSGLGLSSYLGGMAALVLALDDLDFLNPEGTGPLNRSHGAPRSLYT